MSSRHSRTHPPPVWRIPNAGCRSGPRPCRRLQQFLDAVQSCRQGPDPVGSPAGELPVAGECHRGVEARSDAHDATQTRGDARLKFTVVTPRGHRAVEKQHQRMKAARGDRSDRGARQASSTLGSRSRPTGTGCRPPGARWSARTRRPRRSRWRGRWGPCIALRHCHPMRSPCHPEATQACESHPH